MKKQFDVNVKLSGWRNGEIFLQSNDEELSNNDIIELIKNKDTTKLTLTIEQEPSKVIQMSEKEFEGIIDIVQRYADPVAELKNRLKCRRYHKLD